MFTVLLLHQVLLVSEFLLVSYMDKYLPIVHCCGLKSALFASKLLNYWCQNIKLLMIQLSHIDFYLRAQITILLCTHLILDYHGQPYIHSIIYYCYCVCVITVVTSCSITLLSQMVQSSDTRLFTRFIWKKQHSDYISVWVLLFSVASTVT